MKNAEALLTFHSDAPLFTLILELDALYEELLTLLAVPHLLAILGYAAALNRQKQPLAAFIDWLQKWPTDIGLVQRSMVPLHYPYHTQTLLQTASKIDPRKLSALLGRLNALNPCGYHTLSAKMQLEYLFIECLDF